MNDPGSTSHRFVSGGIALHYLAWGDPAAPPLILVHGGQDHAHSWDWVARELCKDWYVICPDLRGHGDSAWSLEGSYSLPFYAADLARLADRCSDGPVSLVAHSLGGAVALRYAGAYPERVRRLAVIEGLGPSPLDTAPNVPVAERWRGWIETQGVPGSRTPRRYATLEQACARMHEMNPRLSEAHVRHLTVYALHQNADGTFSWKFDNRVRSRLPLSTTDEELHGLWHAVDCPVWLVHGAESWARHPGRDGRAAHFQQATVTSYEGAGHWVHHDRLDSFVADLQAFL